MRIRKGDSGALHARMSEIQSAEKDAKKEGWHRTNEDGNTAKRRQNDKTHSGIYQRHEQIKLCRLKELTYLGR